MIYKCQVIFFCHRDLHLNLEMSDTWPCCISRTLPPPRWRNTRCGLPSTSSSNQTPFQGSLKVDACEVYSLIYVDQLECSKEYCNNAPVHLYQCIQSIGVVQQEVSLKSNFRVLLQRFVIAPSMPPQGKRASPPCSQLKQYPTVNMGTSVWERDENIPNCKLGSKPACSSLPPSALAQRPVRHHSPAWPALCSSSFMVAELDSTKTPSPIPTLCQKLQQIPQAPSCCTRSPHPAVTLHSTLYITGLGNSLCVSGAINFY